MNDKFILKFVFSPRAQQNGSQILAPGPRTWPRIPAGPRAGGPVACVVAREEGLVLPPQVEVVCQVVVRLLRLVLDGVEVGVVSVEHPHYARQHNARQQPLLPLPLGLLGGRLQAHKRRERVDQPNALVHQVGPQQKFIPGQAPHHPVHHRAQQEDAQNDGAPPAAPTGIGTRPRRAAGRGTPRRSTTATWGGRTATRKSVTRPKTGPAARRYRRGWASVGKEKRKRAERGQTRAGERRKGKRKRIEQRPTRLPATTIGPHPASCTRTSHGRAHETLPLALPDPPPSCNASSLLSLPAPRCPLSNIQHSRRPQLVAPQHAPDRDLQHAPDRNILPSARSSPLAQGRPLGSGNLPSIHRHTALQPIGAHQPAPSPASGQAAARPPRCPPAPPPASDCAPARPGPRTWHSSSVRGYLTSAVRPGFGFLCLRSALMSSARWMKKCTRSRIWSSTSRPAEERTRM
eukprot:365247-Chlamydomonas_euryale.AAC.15